MASKTKRLGVSMAAGVVALAGSAMGGGLRRPVRHVPHEALADGVTDRGALVLDVS